MGRRLVKAMLKYELKRIFAKRINRVLIAIGLLLAVILSILAATSNRFVTPQGHLETGITATRKIAADKNRNKGLMTPQRISKLIAQDQRTFREYKDKDESDKVYGTSLQQYLDVEQLVSYILTGNEDYNPSVYLDVNPKKLLNIYKIRDQKIRKLIKQNGVDMGQRRLFAWMRENGYLIKRCGSEYNLPTQRSMERGLMEIKETSVIHSGYTTISKTPKVTGKGQVYFINLLVGQREAVTE